MLSPVSPWVNTLFAQHCSTPPTFPTSPVTFSAKNLDVINDQNPFETKRQKKNAVKNGCGLCCTVSTSGPSGPPVSGPLPVLIPCPQQGPSAENIDLINGQDLMMKES